MNLKFPEFIIPAINCKHKYTIIRGGRRIGKTYNLVQWVILRMLKYKHLGLWVDTTQANLVKYVDEYFNPICGDLWGHVQHNKQLHTLTFPNGSVLHMGSAERPENLEGFEYKTGVLNEAGIILKKKGLWHNTLRPMFKSKKAKVKIAGTPKGHNEYEEICNNEELSEQWKVFRYTAYDSPYWDEEELEEIKSNTSSFVWRQEYMAEFVAGDEDSMIKYEELCFYDMLPEITKAYMHIDCTHTGKQTSDFAACGIIGEGKDGKYYLIDCFVERLDQENQARRAIEMYKMYKDNYEIKNFTYDEKSNQGFGYWIKKLAREEYDVSLPIRELKYNADKVSHLNVHIPHFRSERVMFPNEHKYKQRVVNQLVSFPCKGVHDDAVDMISSLLDNFKDKVAPSVYFG